MVLYMKLLINFFYGLFSLLNGKDYLENNLKYGNKHLDLLSFV